MKHVWQKDFGIRGGRLAPAPMIKAEIIGRRESQGQTHFKF